MPFSRAEYLSILQHFERELRAADPGAFEIISAGFEPIEDPRRRLLAYLQRTRHVVAERSSGSEGHVLNILNQFVRTEGGGPISGIRLALSGPDQERYGMEFIDLASLPDRSEFLAELGAVWMQIEQDDSGRTEFER